MNGCNAMENNRVLLKLRNVSKSFGSLVAVNKIDFEVNESEVFGIAGPNGSGKTTLINNIMNIVPADSGEVYFNNHPIHNEATFRICHLGIARVFQNPELFGSLSVMDNMMLGVIYGDRHERESRKMGHIKSVLDLVGLKGKKEKISGGLVIGDQKRLMVAIALATRPKLLILDEPTAGLTHIEATDMISIIKQINKQGITVLIIEHNMRVLMGLSTRVMILNQGKKLCEGTPEEICTNEQVLEIFLGKKYRKEAHIQC